MQTLIVLGITIVAFALVMAGLGIWQMTKGKPVKTPCGGPTCDCSKKDRPPRSCESHERDL